MKIEFWSDIVCPYCGLMDHRLRLALDRFEHASEVTVTHRSFQIHPDLPREGITQRELFEVAGMPQATGEQILTSIEAVARSEGLRPYHALERTLGPTDLAHELLAYATDQGRGDEVWSAMFQAHFGTARKLWTAEQVLAFAAEVGLDREGAAEAMDSRRYRDRVAADQRAAQRLGARGTPFIVLDGRYAIPGAIGTQDLLSALTTAWQESHPATISLLPGVAGTDGVCTPDGCVLPGQGDG
ncbi:DsbA family oxidoreductase [Actinopolymorpha pittospori]|uniref:DsbA family dithiol-disulfide isomerase n=1 Tax=Actinopolymorpha pittospori TaxID=648752 RepID=A0A927NA81_9ACTN|nr:DsbA family oxidoreductase [Actinopolymorpha pittospori]MBE1613078.1 putative DsbA family dithiol-disulfide isomerase [Actinopolymorpha pittospori]